MRLEDGQRLVQTARSTLERVTHPSPLHRQKPALKAPTSTLAKRRGVFVTIRDYPSHDLRGCMGRLSPTRDTLYANTIESAVNAGLFDTRFPSPIAHHELDRVVFEVTVLTNPRPVSAQSFPELLQKIELGRDGIMVDNQWGNAVFLPQVPIEQGWDVTTYYRELCHKAGIPIPICTDPTKTTVSTFQADIFAEQSPNGEILAVNVKNKQN